MSLLPWELKVILKLQLPAACQAELGELIDQHLLINCQCDPGAHGCLPVLFSRHYLFNTHQPYLVSENQDAAGSQVRQASSAEPLCVRSGLVWGWGWVGVCDLPSEHSLQGMLGKTHTLCSQKHFRSVEQYAILTLLAFSRVKGEMTSNALQCAMHVYHTEGLRGFYRGITASYAGVSETIIHFVIYEALKQQLRNSHHSLSPPLTLSPNSHDFFGLMGAAAVSKACASCIAYPHGEWVHSLCFFSPRREMPCL